MLWNVFTLSDNMKCDHVTLSSSLPDDYYVDGPAVGSWYDLRELKYEIEVTQDYEKSSSNRHAL